MAVNDPTLEFCGCLVSIDCGSLGYFQGKVLKVDHQEKIITIERPLKNGIPMTEKFLSLNSLDIQDIKVIKMPPKSNSYLSTASTINSSGKLKKKYIKENNYSTSTSVVVNNISKLKVAQKYDNKLDSSNSVNQNLPGPSGMPLIDLSSVNTTIESEKNNSDCNIELLFKNNLKMSDVQNLSKADNLESDKKLECVLSNNGNASESLCVETAIKKNNSIENDTTSSLIKAKKNNNVTKKKSNENIKKTTSDITLEFCGCLVSIDCGSLGYFQGKVLKVDHQEKIITIERPLKNGIPMSEKVLSLSSSDIKDIKVIKMPLKNESLNTFTNEKQKKKINSKEKKTKESTNLTSESIISSANNNNNNNNINNNNTFKLKLLQKNNNKSIVSSNIGIQNIPVSVLSSKSSKILLTKLNEKKKDINSGSSINGVRISVSELLINRAKQKIAEQYVSSVESTSETISTPKSSKDNESMSKIPKENKKSSPNLSINKTSKFKNFGEFRHFEEQEVPAPRQLKICKRNNSQGPSGFPLLDFSNGYSGYAAKNAHLGEPIDFDLNADFDFDGNLALFEKHKLSDTEDLLSNEDLGPPPIIVKNFRNDENVLSDPSRTFSWTQNSNALSSFGSSKVNGLRISVNELLNKDPES